MKKRITALCLSALIAAMGIMTACDLKDDSLLPDDGGNTQQPNEPSNPNPENPNPENPNPENPNPENPNPENPNPNPENPDPNPEPEPVKEALVLSHERGVYTDPFTLAVSKKDDKHKVYYTLDGSKPTAQSAKYEDSGIAINDPSKTMSYDLTHGVTHDQNGYGKYNYTTGIGCTVLNLLEVDENGEEVAHKTLTYFIQPDGEAHFPLPVVSLSMSDEVMLGFYNDIANESKVRAEMEYFDFVNDEYFAYNTQIKVGGNWTKGFPYRTMNVNFNKDENGDKNKPIEFNFFGDRTARDGSELTKFKRFRLHSGGNSQTMSWFGDAFTQKVAAEVSAKNGEMITAATAGYRPIEVYINGEYWGMYAIREHYSDVYFEQNYGVDKDDVIMLDRSPYVYDGAPGQDDPLVFNGTYHFEVGEDDEDETGMQLALQLFNFLMNTDLTIAKNYETLSKMVDLTSLSDLILVHAYGGNWDFLSNNIKMWRTANVDPENPYADGRWRFCLHDLDFSLENQWGDVGVGGANAYLTRNGELAPLSEYTNFNTDYMTGNNYIDYYLGIANYNGGWLSKENHCIISTPMQSAQFRDLFIDRAQVVNEVYSNAQAITILHDMEEEVDTVMKRHLTRWGREGFGYNDWQYFIDRTHTVLENRPYLVDEHNAYELGKKLYTNGNFFLYQVRDALTRFVNTL